MQIDKLLSVIENHAIPESKVEIDIPSNKFTIRVDKMMLKMVEWLRGCEFVHQCEWETNSSEPELAYSVIISCSSEEDLHITWGII